MNLCHWNTSEPVDGWLRCIVCDRKVRTKYPAERVRFVCRRLNLGAYANHRCRFCTVRQQKLNGLIPHAGDIAKKLIEFSRLDRLQNLRRPKLLIRAGGGLGDCVYLTVAVRHIRALFPRWKIYVAAHNGYPRFAGLARGRFRKGSEPPPASFDLAVDSHWPAWPDTAYADSPSSGVCWWLRTRFGIRPIEALCRPLIRPDWRSRQRARQFATTVGPFVLIHYEGTSDRPRKNLNPEAIEAAIRAAHARGLATVLLDFDGASPCRALPGVVPLGAHHSIFGGHHGDAETIVALANRARLCVGIDSGPGHCFGASRTPTLICWELHHPVNFYGLSPNVTHLLRNDHSQRIMGEQRLALEYFQRRYRHRLIGAAHRDALGEEVWRALDGSTQRLRAD